MYRIIGIACWIVALLLLLQGHDIANSIGSQVTRAFTGEPTGKARHYYLAGIAVGLCGTFLIFWKKKKG